jgi:hypothetical protein
MTTMPSNKVLFVDTPEVEGFTAEFVYNFFTPDEKTNDTGKVQSKFLLNKRPEEFDSEFLQTQNFVRFVPRFVKFNWVPPANTDRVDLINVSIKDNLDKIYDEEFFQAGQFTNVFFQDDGRDEKMKFFVRRAISEIGQALNPSTGSTDLNLSELGSQMDIVKFLNKNTSPDIRAKFLADVFVNEGDLQYLDQNDKEIKVNNLLKELKSIKVKSHVNNKIIHKALKTTKQNTLNIFEDEIKDLIKTAKEVEERAISEHPGGKFDIADFDFEIDNYVSYRPLDVTGFVPTSQVVGYMVEKWEILSDGREIKKEPIFIETPFATEAVDLRIKYDTHYRYTVRTINFIETQAIDLETGKNIVVGFLVSSSPSNYVTFKTEDFTPPPIVKDFTITWDYTLGALRLVWNFGTNPQRDVKYFQILRRKTIHEPFELIKMYDFDNSIIRSPLSEEPSVELIEKQNRNIAKTYFIDEEFRKDSKYIYTICSVDAHGFSSNYSTQFECHFDRTKNKLVKKLISVGNAPKSYPNLFLDTNIFTNSIRTSGHRRVKVVFSPEYLRVTNQNDDDLGLIKTCETNEVNEYRLQMINVDLQQQETVKIKIKDLRKTEER